LIDISLPRGSCKLRCPEQDERAESTADTPKVLLSIDVAEAGSIADVFAGNQVAVRSPKSI
jgi:hypothetical protein